MMNSGTEIINLAHASSAAPEVVYQLQFISTDKRISDPTKTTLGYNQVGGPLATDKIGNANGPIFMMECVDIPAGAYIRVWALDNKDADGVVYPTDYLIDNPKIEVYLRKFEWTDIAGTTVAAPVAYSIFGHRKRSTFINV